MSEEREFPRVSRVQLLARIKSEIREIGAGELAAHLDNGLTVVDVRERDEFVQGYIPGSIFIPRGYLELQIEQWQPKNS